VNTDATIFFYAQDDDTVEVLIGPVQYRYYDNHETEDHEHLDQHAIAE